MKKLNLQILLKAVAIGILILIMLIPLSFVKSTINDRDFYRDKAVSKITESWGGSLIVAAPILNIPYFREVKVEKGEGKDKKTETQYAPEYAKFSPKDLDVSVDIEVQTRYIGIFKVPVYIAQVTMKGSFDKVNYDFKESDFNNAFITLEVSDLKGISIPEFTWDEKSIDFKPAVYGNSLKLATVVRNDRNDYNYKESLTLRALNAPVKFNNSNNTFELKFSIKGSRDLSFIPLARDNRFNMHSKWQTPSFSGAFLPDTKEVNAEGFVASWNINYMASGISERFDGKDLSASLFTTSILIPVDNYRNALRASKYGILFIILTFFVCFLFEVKSKKPIHPLQYLLVGFAMAVFYSLLISISEFIPFGFAYLISSVATITLITAYVKIAIAKTISAKQTISIALALTFLYSYLYVLLQLEDMALLFGSIGLFVGLAIIMYVTRNISWYEEV